MFPDLEFIKTCLNGLRNRIENFSKEIDKKISYNLEVSKADWNQNDQNSPEYVKNRPMYSYQENIGTKYSISDLTTTPLPLVLGEEWYVMGIYAGVNDRYLPDDTKTIFTVGKNSSGDLCIASDNSFGFSTGSEASSGNRFIVYSDHIYQNASWKQAMRSEVLRVYRLAEPSYKIAYKTIEPNFLPRADGETTGIVNPYLTNSSETTSVGVDKDGRLYCDTRMPISIVRSTLSITLDWPEIGFMPFLMLYRTTTSTTGITINGNLYTIYIDGTPSQFRPNAAGGIFLAVAEATGRKLHLVKNPMVVSSSTPDSTKKFEITVDDSGTIKAKGV